MVHGLIEVQPAEGIRLTWFTETGSLVSKASRLRITTASLALVAMFASMEWTHPLEELGSLVLNYSGVGSHWMVLSAKSLYNSHPSSLFFFKNPPWHIDSDMVFV